MLTILGQLQRRRSKGIRAEGNDGRWSGAPAVAKLLQFGAIWCDLVQFGATRQVGVVDLEGYDARGRRSFGGRTREVVHKSKFSILAQQVFLAEEAWY
jgi:hypothetical protein